MLMINLQKNKKDQIFNWQLIKFNNNHYKIKIKHHKNLKILINKLIIIKSQIKNKYKICKNKKMKIILIQI